MSTASTHRATFQYPDPAADCTVHVYEPGTGNVRAPVAVCVQGRGATTPGLMHSPERFVPTITREVGRHLGPAYTGVPVLWFFSQAVGESAPSLAQYVDGAAMPAITVAAADLDALVREAVPLPPGTP